MIKIYVDMHAIITVHKNQVTILTRRRRTLNSQVFMLSLNREGTQD